MPAHYGKKKPGARKPAVKSKTPPAKMPKKPMSPLDKAILEGRKLPSKNRRPGRYLDK